MITRIDHIGIAVRSLETSLPLWADALGLEVGSMETIESERVKVAFLLAGSSRIELLESLDEDSAVGKHLRKRGEGVHHVTLEVRDLDQALDRARAKGMTVVGGGARDGAEGRRVAFLHPRSTGGVLVELVGARSPHQPPSRLDPGSPVLLYLQAPQEKLWGVLRRLDTTGVVIEGIDLSSFDDWVAQIERGEQSVVGPSVIFVPMTRLEKILLDRPSGDLPSLAERFQRRTGRSVQEVLGDDGG